MSGWGHGGKRFRQRQQGVTLLEMMVVVVLVGILAGISFPAISSGVDSLRLSSAADGAASFINSALARAERRQEVVEIAIYRQRRGMRMRSTEPGFSRELELPDGVEIAAVLPRLPGDEDPTLVRRVMVYPGGTAPGIGLLLANRKGQQRIVRVDPITGVTQVEAVEPGRGTELAQ